MFSDKFFIGLLFDLIKTIIYYGNFSFIYKIYINKCTYRYIRKYLEILSVIKLKLHNEYYSQLKRVQACKDIPADCKINYSNHSGYRKKN